MAKGKIHLEDKANTNGFDKNPQNINRTGQNVSIKRQLKDLLESDGNITFPAKQVIKVNDDGSVTLKLPTQMQLAMKLSSWAMSKKGNDSLKAIQIIMEYIDGKPNQNIELNNSVTITKDYEKVKNELGEDVVNRISQIVNDVNDDDTINFDEH